MIFDFDELDAAGTLPIQGKIIYEAGLKQMVGTPLVKEQEKFGFIIFYSDIKNNFAPQNLSLIEDIASLISPALANIIANERIELKEKETQILLSLSAEMAKVRDKSDLLPIIRHKLKKGFRTAIFCLVVF